MPGTTQVVSITGRQTTASPVEETLLLSEDRAAPAASLSVPPQTTLIISDVDCGIANGGHLVLRLEQDNGVGFYTIARIKAESTVLAKPKVAWVIDGNAGVAVLFRVQIQTPDVKSADITCTIRAYREF